MQQTAIPWGRLVLIKSLLEAIPVYWHLLAGIVKGVLVRIHKLCFNYLRKGSLQYKGSHLANWSTLSKPKNLGGLGSKGFMVFRRA